MNNIFAERLKKAMEQKNMKQIDLVKKAAEQGVKLGKSHVSQYLSGKTTPRSEILNFLATTLGVLYSTHISNTQMQAEQLFLSTFAGKTIFLKEGFTMKKDGYYSSGEFARMAHVTLRTIRYYDKQNILKPSYVTESGARFLYR